jgi:hypothetical protein
MRLFYNRGPTVGWLSRPRCPGHYRPPAAVAADRSRLHIVSAGILRGFAPIRRVDQVSDRCWTLGRDGFSAEAVAIMQEIRSFRGWRYRWWDRDQEVPFDDWAWESVPPRPC